MVPVCLFVFVSFSLNTKKCCWHNVNFTALWARYFKCFWPKVFFKNVQTKITLKFSLFLFHNGLPFWGPLKSRINFGKSSRKLSMNFGFVSIDRQVGVVSIPLRSAHIYCTTYANSAIYLK